MKVIYCDSGLLSNSGHHANFARSIVGELRKRNIDVDVLAYKDVISDLQYELQATPFFTYYTYNDDKQFNKISGWLTTFLAGAELIRKDLMLLFDGNTLSDKDTIFYFNSVNPTVCWGIVQWMYEFNSYNIPKVIVEFNQDPGLDIEQVLDGQVKTSIRNPLIDSRSVLWNFIGTNLTDEILSNLYMVTFEQGCSDSHSAILERKVKTLPIPKDGPHVLRNRGDSSPRTVAFLGHQRSDRGYEHTPNIIRNLKNENVKFLVHNSANDMPEVQKEIEELAKYDKRVTIDTTQADAEYWQKLLDMSDLIALPYTNRYILSYSAVACDAIANGIPMVTPLHSSMNRQIEEYYGNIDISFINSVTDEHKVEDICYCIRHNLNHFKNKADEAFNAALKWKEKQGVVKCVDKMLEMVK